MGDILPPTFEPSEVISDDSWLAATTDDVDSGVWYVKSVIQGGPPPKVFSSSRETRDHLEKSPASSRHLQVVQRGVLPPALTDQGRRFVLRAYVLLHGPSTGEPTFYLHRDVLALEHGRPF